MSEMWVKKILFIKLLNFFRVETRCSNWFTWNVKNFSWYCQCGVFWWCEVTEYSRDWILYLLHLCRHSVYVYQHIIHTADSNGFLCHVTRMCISLNIALFVYNVFVFVYVTVWNGNTFIPLHNISCTTYCKTLYFSCISIWRFCGAEILLHFNLPFFQGVFCKVKFQVTFVRHCALPYVGQ